MAIFSAWVEKEVVHQIMWSNNLWTCFIHRLSCTYVIYYVLTFELHVAGWKSLCLGQSGQCSGPFIDHKLDFKRHSKMTRSSFCRLTAVPSSISTFLRCETDWTQTKFSDSSVPRLLFLGCFFSRYITNYLLPPNGSFKLELLSEARRVAKLRNNAARYQQLQCHPLAGWDDVWSRRGWMWRGDRLLW